MATRTYTMFLGKRLRVTVLDSCGRVPAPSEEDAFMVADGFVTVNLSANVEEGTEITKRNAAGQLCVNEKLSDNFKRFGVEIEFCGVNPSLVSMVSNAEPYTDWAGDIAGFTVPEGEMTKQFALEVWTGLTGVACEAGAEDASGYILLPFIKGGSIGDFSIGGENDVTFTLTGAYTKGGNAWGTGPYEVLMDGAAEAPLPTALDPLDPLLLIDTALAPPPAADDPQIMPALPVTTTTTSV